MDHPSSVVDEAIGQKLRPARTSSRGEVGLAEGALDGQEDDRRPVESARYAAGESNLRRHRERRPDHAAFDRRAGGEWKRAHAIEPAAAWSMSPRRFSVVAVVMILVTAAMHAVIHGIGIGEAVERVAAVAEGYDRWRCDEAKCG